MQDVALQGLVVEGRPEDFESFWWFRPFGLDVQAVFELLPEAMQKAQQVVPETGPERRAARPLPPDEPEGRIFVWPTRHTGLTVLLTQIDGAWSMTGCWPFLTTGTEHDAEIRSVGLAPERLRAMVEVAIADTIDLTYHDYAFATKRGLYVKGVDHRLVLCGIAHAFGPADTAPVNLDIAVTEPMLEGRPLPALGDDVEALILLQGSICILAINSRAPDAAAPHLGQTEGT